MVEYLKKYEALLQQGAQTLDSLMQLYIPDIKHEKDWADISAADTRNKRNSLMERLMPPIKVTTAQTSTLVVSLGHYLDSHWADYQENFPVADAQKRKQLELLHIELTNVVNGIGAIYNELRTR